MPTYLSYDRAELAYRELGAGLPLLVVPGGPARDATYLGDLGGLASLLQRKLVVPDLRGTGDSRPDTDPDSHRADRIAADVATLVDHLRMAPLDVLAHSAGADVALLLAERRPDLVARLVLVAPDARVVGIEPPQDAPDAPAAGGGPRNEAAARWFHDGAYDPERSRTTLASLGVPVRVLLGELDPWPNARAGEELAVLFPDVRVAVLPGAGHFPWVDDASAYALAVRDALLS